MRQFDKFKSNKHLFFRLQADSFGKGKVNSLVSNIIKFNNHKTRKLAILKWQKEKKKTVKDEGKNWKVKNFQHEKDKC